jgi:membrane-associated phospholipid phosphatase
VEVEALEAQADLWRRVRWAAATVYFLALAAYVVTQGVPTNRIVLIAVVLVGLGISRIGRGWRASGQILVDWVPFTAVLIAYDQTRGLADKLGIPLHEADIAHAEDWLFGDVNPTIWLQHHLHPDAAVHWYDAIVSVVYVTHFVATPVLAAVLWLRNREVWIQFITRVILLSVAGLLTYIAFPEAPPLLAAQDGVLAPIQRLSAQGWIWLHAGNLDALLSRAQNEGSNPVAAMPSLHVAFACLVAIFIARQIRSRWGRLTYLYPVAMAFTLVYTGEHYVLDLIFGLVYVLAVHLAVTRWEDRRAQRRAITVAETTTVDPPAQEALETR